MCVSLSMMGQSQTTEGHKAYNVNIYSFFVHRRIGVAIHAPRMYIGETTTTASKDDTEHDLYASISGVHFMWQVR